MPDLVVVAEQLKAFTQEVFVRVGISEEDAEIQAEVLVWANLRGVDSHGVLRIPVYVDFVDKGWMNPRPNIRVVVETPATLLIDADCAPGPAVTTRAMVRVIKKAREVGIGWALIRNTTHQGALGYYSRLAAIQGLAGLAIVCSPPNMAPYRGPGRGGAQQPHHDRRAGRTASAARPGHGHECSGGWQASSGHRQRDPNSGGVGTQQGW